MPLEQILSEIDIYYIEIAREPLEIIVMTDVVVDGRFDKRQLTTDIKTPSHKSNVRGAPSHYFCGMES